ncbi:MAG: hypothetical protein KA954_12250 [Chitinophagales bacterium]|nr:hypothetical protein [Chitinophagales bacterium]
MASPLLFPDMDVLKEKIQEWLAPKLEELDCFLVDIRHNPSNGKFEIFMDTDAGVTISACEQVSRYLNFYMENDPAFGDNYMLDVSSPGMENPFKVERQYLKNIGKTVELVLHSGVKKEGILKQYDGEKLTLQIALPVKVKGKKPELVEEEFTLEEIKSTKKKISF